MSTKEVYDYVMHTPRNTNPAVLNSMLGHLSWNDLKDKPFYEEVVIHPYTVLLEADLLENSDVYTIEVEMDRCFVDGDIVEATYSGSSRYDDVTVTGVAKDDGEYGIFVNFNNPNDNDMQLHYYDGMLRVSSAWYTHAVVKLLPSKEVVVHTVDPKFVPNSAWLEEETFALVENVPMDTDGDGGYYASVDTDTALMVGDIVSVVLSNSDDGREGITVTGSVEEFRSVNATQYHLVHDGDFYCECRSTVWDYGGISLNVAAEHYQCATVIVNRQVVKTNCDLMITCNVVNDEADNRLVQGDFATAKAKITKGLPVRAYMLVTEEHDDGSKITTPCFDFYCSYYYSPDEEYIYVNGCYTFYVYPDGSVTG